MPVAEFKKKEVKPIIKTDSELLTQIEAAEAEKSKQDKIIKMAKGLLLQSRHEEIQALLKAKDEPFGSIDLIIGNHKVSVVTPKKVEWEQDRLRAICAEMVAEGVEPLLYMKIKYDISETAFENWPQDMQDYFRDARTVTPGNPSLKIVTEKE